MVDLPCTGDDWSPERRRGANRSRPDGEPGRTGGAVGRDHLSEGRMTAMGPSLRSPVVRILDLPGWRVRLATLVESDYQSWLAVRKRCRPWLVPWEPRSKGAPMAPEDAASFAARCGIRERERQLGSGFGFGIFVEDRFAGEVTLSSIQRGPFPERLHRVLDRRRARRVGIGPGGGRRRSPVCIRDTAASPSRGGHHSRNVASRRVAEKLGSPRWGGGRDRISRDQWRMGGPRSLRSLPPRNGRSGVLSCGRPG